MRLDRYLVEQFHIQSRNKAIELIKDGNVKVDNKIVKKSSFNINNQKVELIKTNQYVSRAGLKLSGFLKNNPLDLLDKTALDIGSSTGGFTQVLIESGVKKIVCVDVGSNQLHTSLRDNKKITLYENTDIREFKTEEKFDIVVCDVSFISLFKIIEAINRVAGGDIILLFKPQFEVGIEAKRDKKGVVIETKQIINIKNSFINKCKKIKWRFIKEEKSIISGKNGNEEYVLYFKKD